MLTANRSGMPHRRIASPLRKMTPRLEEILFHHFPDVASPAMQDGASRIERHSDRRFYLRERRHHELVWGFHCQGGVTPFWSSFAFHSFVRPAPRAFFRPDRIFPSPSRAATVKDGASSAPPKACP